MKSGKNMIIALAVTAVLGPATALLVSLSSGVTPSFLSKARA